MGSLAWWFSPHPSWEPGEDWARKVPVVCFETDDALAVDEYGRRVPGATAYRIYEPDNIFTLFVLLQGCSSRRARRSAERLHGGQTRSWPPPVATPASSSIASPPDLVLTDRTDRWPDPPALGWGR